MSEAPDFMYHFEHITENDKQLIKKFYKLRPWENRVAEEHNLNLISWTTPKNLNNHIANLEMLN